MSRATIVTLKTLICVLFVGAVFVQTFYVPVLAGQQAELYPEVGFLRLPLTVLAVAVIACAEVALFCIWTLLSMVSKESIFTRAAYKYVNAIIAAFAIGTALLAGLNVYLVFVIHANPPWMMLVLTGGTVGGAALALLMVVMRGLLRKASTLEYDLAEVV
jgi:hypothetical protein